MKLFEAYLSLSLDGALIGFEKGSAEGGYYCTPARMTVLGWDGGIHFGTIEGYGETIFAVDPEAYGHRPPVFPMAENFRDFLSLILAAGHTAALEQIYSFPFTREQFEAYVRDEALFASHERRELLQTMQNALGLSPIVDPYGYVKALQAGFDRTRLPMTEEYYDTIGEEVTTACKCAKKTEAEHDFVSVSEICIACKKEEN